VAPRKDQNLVQLSVLDRLIDDAPRLSSEVAGTLAQAAREYKASVRRDLEWLLNTRRIADAPDLALAEVNHSMLVYGLPDFTTLSLHSPADQEHLLKTVRQVIRIFEPRLARVEVTPMGSPEGNSRTLRFRIEGMLRMDPAPEHVSFDTILELTSGEYEVKGEANA
jgi:type VI secretion system protein ImpF